MVRPVTIPDDDPIIAFVISLLPHIPPPVLASVILEPIQTDDGPLVAGGSGLVFAKAVTKQPLVFVYAKVLVPDETPVSKPVDEPILATGGEDELHVPPGVPLYNNELAPAQIVETPAIADGKALIVSIAVVVQPVLSWQVIVAVPGLTPVTIPVDEPIVAIGILLLVQLPGVALPNVALVPEQILPEPVTGVPALTVAVTVALVPHPVE